MRSSRILVLAGLLSQISVAVPITKRTSEFGLQSYADFQISDGVGGNAESQANAVFVTPFDGVDLSTVDSTSLANVETMHQDAEDAETSDFDPQIAAASGAAADALNVGKIKNKVLKLTGEIQGLKIKLAQQQSKGESTSSTESSITEEQTKLTNNIKLDQANAGKTSKGVA